MQEQRWGPASFYQIHIRQLQGEDEDSSCSLKPSLIGCLRWSFPFIPWFLMLQVCIKTSTPHANTTLVTSFQQIWLMPLLSKKVQWWPHGPAIKCSANSCRWLPAVSRLGPDSSAKPLAWKLVLPHAVQQAKAIPLALSLAPENPGCPLL